MRQEGSADLAHCSALTIGSFTYCVFRNCTDQACSKSTASGEKLEELRLMKSTACRGSNLPLTRLFARFQWWLLLWSRILGAGCQSVYFRGHKLFFSLTWILLTFLGTLHSSSLWPRLALSVWTSKISWYFTYISALTTACPRCSEHHNHYLFRSGSFRTTSFLDRWWILQTSTSSLECELGELATYQSVCLPMRGVPFVVLECIRQITKSKGAQMLLQPLVFPPDQAQGSEKRSPGKDDPSKAPPPVESYSLVFSKYRVKGVQSGMVSNQYQSSSLFSCFYRSFSQGKCPAVP